MLHSIVLNLKQENSELTCINPVLDSFSLDICQKIDLAITDNFIKIKIRNILNYLKDHKAGHSGKLKQALDEYSEADIYLFFQEKRVLIGRVPERKNENTPDFKIDIKGEVFFLEIKTLGFAEGDLNYRDAINRGLDARVSLEQQIRSGKTVAIAEISFNPLQSQKLDYLDFYRVFFIEKIVQKIQQNLKEKQFKLGRTVLLIDLSLINVHFDYQLEAIPVFQEPTLKSMVSGLLWHIAFGNLDERVFSPIKFEGASNIEGQLKVEGLLNSFDWIKALCFQTYNVSRERAIVGLYRSKDEDEIVPFLCSFCDFINDELNTHGWEVLQKNN